MMIKIDPNRQARAVALLLAIVGAVLCLVGWLEWARVG
jgi:hypothetical protein